MQSDRMRMAILVLVLTATVAAGLLLDATRGQKLDSEQLVVGFLSVWLGPIWFPVVALTHVQPPWGVPAFVIFFAPVVLVGLGIGLPPGRARGPLLVSGCVLWALVELMLVAASE
jgi:hypothetical protein